MNKPILGTIIGATLLGLAKAASGSMSLKDIIFRAETRGGKHWYELSKVLNPDPEFRKSREKALTQIVFGEAMLGNIELERGREYSIEELDDKYFEWTGYTRRWSFSDDKYKVRSSNFSVTPSRLSGYGYVDPNYLIQRAIFRDSIYQGKTFYITVKPDDMYDPILEDGFVMNGFDAHYDLSEVFNKYNWDVKKGRPSPYKIVIENLKSMGINSFEELVEKGKATPASEECIRDIKSKIASLENDRNRRMFERMPDDQMNIVCFVQHVWKQVWTIEARTEARKLRKKQINAGV